MLKKDELYKVIDQVPVEKLDDLIQYAKKLSIKDESVSTDEFEHAYKITTRKYDKALRNLVQR